MSEAPLRPAGPLPLDKLEAHVASGHVDTVLVVFTDPLGRLQGKRISGRHFVSTVRNAGTRVCDYLFTVDVDMQAVAGYDLANWTEDYGDILLMPDLSTLRPVPWLPMTAMVQCDAAWLDGSPIAQAPRQVLRSQADLAAALGYSARAAVEATFTAYEETYPAAWDAHYQGLTPLTRYDADYSVVGSSRAEPLLRDIRNAMDGAGLVVESSRGQSGRGQFEVTFAHAPVVTAADWHAVYRSGAKEVASRHEKSVTFMSRFDDGPGNSCHLHLSLHGVDGGDVFEPQDALGGSAGRTDVFHHFLAGILVTLRPFSLLYAPNINSYKRFQPGSPSPTAVAWGEDNRTCGLRVTGRGSSLRVENRVPGGDVNPYLGLAAMLAGGLYGVQERIELPPPLIGNAAEADVPRMPTTLREARDLFASSPEAASCFGQAVVDHYVHAADAELAAFEAAVTDWERIRGFERL